MNSVDSGNKRRALQWCRLSDRTVKQSWKLNTAESIPNFIEIHQYFSKMKQVT